MPRFATGVAVRRRSTPGRSLPPGPNGLLPGSTNWCISTFIQSGVHCGGGSATDGRCLGLGFEDLNFPTHDGLPGHGRTRSDQYQILMVSDKGDVMKRVRSVRSMQMDRRDFIKTAGAGALGAASLSWLAAENVFAADGNQHEYFFVSESLRKYP